MFSRTLASLLTVVLVPSFAGANEVVNGPKIGIMLPKRPVGSYENSMRQRASHREQPAYDPVSKTNSLSRAIEVCPKAAAVFDWLFGKLISSNGLESFVREGPGLGLRIRCEDGPRRLARIDAQNNVKLSSNLLDIFEYEDEVAAIMAHEMAHVLLGHGELLWDLNDRKKEDTLMFKIAEWNREAQWEIEADRLGAYLAWNAGFNPLILKSTINKLLGWNRWIGFLEVFVPHHTASQRQARLEAQFGSQASAIAEIPLKPLKLSH